MITNSTSRRGLSPLFAVLILISITVVSGIIVYMFSSGLLGSLMIRGSVEYEKVAIEASMVDPDINSVSLYCKSLVDGAVNITDAILSDVSGKTLEVLMGVNSELAADGTLSKVDCNFTYDLQADDVYAVTLISKAGNQFISKPFKA